VVPVKLPWRRAACLIVSLAATGASGLNLLFPIDVSERARTLTLRPQQRAESGVVHVTLRKNERPRDVAEAYGVDANALGVDPDKPQPAGALLRVPVNDATDRRLPPGVITHTVRRGDTLESIASDYGLRTIDIVSANLDRQSLDRLAVGESLFVPTLERGLLVRVKPGQDVLGLARLYKTDIVAVARANALRSPSDVNAGDLLLLPGVKARTHMSVLLARREREQENERKRRALAQYERYLAYKKEVQRRALQAKYERQKKYEQYVAYMNSPQRKAMQAKYERQAKYEQYLAAQRAKVIAQANAEAARKSSAARVASSASASSGVVRRSAFGGDGIRWPMKHFRITSRFGERDIEFHRLHFHGGVDFAAPYGTPIYAATSGVVEQSGHGDYGLNVWMRSGNATLIYGHMSQTAVRAGQTVQAGQVIGYVGCTGVCTGPHLHFETRINGVPVDPLTLLP